MFAKIETVPYVSDLKLSRTQKKFMINQVMDQLDKFYNRGDQRKIILQAFTGSGKTTVTIKELVPQVIEKFNVRVIGFVAPLVGVSNASYKMAKNSLDGKTVAGKVIEVCDSERINDIKRNKSRGIADGIKGDVVFVTMSSQYFHANYDELTSSGVFDLMIVDEAHIFVGTTDSEDTKADKGRYDKNFVPKTLNTMNRMDTCAFLFLTATPTKSQQMETDLGQENNVYLDPVPRDVLTTPFFDIKSYLDCEDVVFKSLSFFHDLCGVVAKLMKEITPDTWSKSKVNIFPTYPGLMIRLARSNTRNGVSFDQYLDEIRAECKRLGFILFISTSEMKEFDGKKIRSIDEGVDLAMAVCNAPVVVLTVDSGYAGMDYVKLNNVSIGREPSSGIHNNWSQTAGRAARIKFFRNHAEAVETIRGYDISDEQKLLLAEYYCLHNTSTVHIPVDSKVLNVDVREFIETDTFRSHEGRKYVLDKLFGIDSTPILETYTILKDDTYKRYKKDYCEHCNTASNGKTHCYNVARKGFQSATNKILPDTYMNMLWKMCLHVHHKDGNHFNHSPSNLVTICPNVHAIITMQSQDYLNRYPELRESLKRISEKKVA